MSTPSNQLQPGQGPPIEIEEYDRLRLTDVTDYPSFVKLWTDKRDTFYGVTRTEFYRLHTRHLVNQNYLDSKHFRHIDPESGRMYEFTPEREWAHVDNQFEYFIESMVANAIKSVPGLTVKVRTDDKAVQGDLRMAQHYVDCIRPLSERELARAEYQRFLRARIWVYTCPSMSGPKVKTPTYGESQAGEASPAMFYCPTCGRSGEGPEPVEGIPQPTCPYCGAPDIVTLPAAEAAMVVTKTGEHERDSYSCRSFLIDDFNMRWYLPSGSPLESPFLCYDRLELREHVYERYPWLRPNATGTGAMSAGSDIHLRAKDEAQRSVGAWNQDPFVVSGLSSRGGESDTLRCHVQDFWLKPEQYRTQFHKIPNGIRLASGDVIPPDVPLGKIWPKGACCVFVDNNLVDIRHEAAVDYWDTDEFKPNPAGGVPRGAEVMVANQNIHNALRIYQLALIATEANGNIIAHPLKITNNEERKKIGKPGRVVFAHGLLPGESPTAAAQRLQAGPPSALVEAAQVEERNVGSMQAHSQTYSVNPNVDKAPINTATGVNELAAQVEALAEPRLKRRAEFMASVAEKHLRFAVEYDHDERYYARSDDSGREVGKWMTPADLKGDFYVEYDPESHVVRTNAQKKSDVAIGLPLAIQALSLKEVDPETGDNLFRIVMEVFKLDDLLDDGRRDWEAIAYKRIERMTEEMIQQTPVLTQQLAMASQLPAEMDPMTGEIINPVDQLMDEFAASIADKAAKCEPDDDDDIIINCYRRYRASPEGQELDEPTRRVILMAIALQMRAKQEKEMMFAQLLGQTQVAGAAPGMQAGAAGQEQMAQQEMGRQSQMADQQAGREEAGKAGDFERQQQQQMADHARDQEKGKADHSRNVELETMRQHGALAKEIAKPKPAPKR